MREGGKKLKEIMKELENKVRPRISTLELDKLAEELILKAGGIPAFKGYGGYDNPFPGTICASLNDEVVHGVPSAKTILREGDLLKIDIGMKYENYFSDMSRSFAVGQVSERVEKIIEITERSFWEGVRKMKAGGKLSDYSKAVQRYVEGNGFSVVRNLVGHGVGKKLHEDPQVPNFWNKKYGEVWLEEGMTLALEPMVNEGAFETKMGNNGWVFVTRDRKLSAHYENTIVITKKGVEVLTA